MSVNISALQFYSGYGVDKILNVVTGSFTATQNTGSISTGATATIGVNDLVYFDGVYTIDGGSAQDFGALASTANTNSFQTWILCTNNTFTIRYTSQDVASHTIAYKIFVIARSTTTSYTGLTPPANLLYLGSKFNYQKIAIDTTQSVTFTVGSGATPVDTVVTIAHNLGYRPSVRAFIDDGTTLASTMDNTSTLEVGNGTVTCRISEDNTNIYFTYTNTSASYTANLSCRAYYEAN